VTAAGISILAGAVVLAGKCAFGIAGFAAAGLFAVMSAAAGFAVAALAAPARLGLTRFFATAGAASVLLVSSSGRATGGWLSPKDDISALRALSADAFIANLVAPETSMNELSLVNRTRNADRPNLPGRRLGCCGVA
jgi:hypothetical protein